MAEAVVVGVRVRPFNAREIGLCATPCIEMDGPQTRIVDDNGKVTPFTFDESLWSHDGYDKTAEGYLAPAPGSSYADQQYVFNTFGKRVLNNAWDGFHCCLFAYGQTGAGKSYSMIGEKGNSGIVPISCKDIFRRIDNNTKPEHRFEVTVSMVEIYNEHVQDLLVLPEERHRKGLEIRESKVLGIYIDGVTRRPVQSYLKIEATVDEALKNRTIGDTLMNATSSRAHTVQTIEFKQITKNDAGRDEVKVSMINLVDLAGSEKAKQTGARGERLQQGAAINKSLSALGNVIEKLAERSSSTGKSKILVPYRDSKLTRLLQNALGGSSKTIMICALSPASSNYDETMSALRYADRTKKIKNTAVVNENPQDRLMRELKEENERLREMMMMVAQGDSTAVLDPQMQAALEAKKEEIADVESALAEMQKSFEERIQEAKMLEEQNQVRRSTIGRGRSYLTPLLVNLNQDARLTGRLKYQIWDEAVTRIGAPPHDKSHRTERVAQSSWRERNSSSEGEREPESEEGSQSDCSSSSSSSDDNNSPEIVLMSESVSVNHAQITHIDGECWLLAKGDSAHSTFVNGQSLAALMRLQAAVSNQSCACGSVFMCDTEYCRECGQPCPLELPKDADGESAVKPQGYKLEHGESAVKPQGYKLEHGHRVIFGACYFFFVAAETAIPEQMILSGQIDWNMANKELKQHSLPNARQSVLNRLMSEQGALAVKGGWLLSGDEGYDSLDPSSDEDHPSHHEDSFRRLSLDCDWDNDAASQEVLIQMVRRASNVASSRELEVAQLQAKTERELKAKDVEIADVLLCKQQELKAKDDEMAELRAALKAKDARISELESLIDASASSPTRFNFSMDALVALDSPVSPLKDSPQSPQSPLAIEALSALDKVEMSLGRLAKQTAHQLQKRSLTSPIRSKSKAGVVDSIGR